MISKPSRVRKGGRFFEVHGYYEILVYVYLVRFMSYFPLKLVNFGFLCRRSVMRGVIRFWRKEP